MESIRRPRPIAPSWLQLLFPIVAALLLRTLIAGALILSLMLSIWAAGEPFRDCAQIISTSCNDIAAQNAGSHLQNPVRSARSVAGIVTGIGE